MFSTGYLLAVVVFWLHYYAFKEIFYDGLYFAYSCCLYVAILTVICWLAELCCFVCSRFWGELNMIHVKCCACMCVLCCVRIRPMRLCWWALETQWEYVRTYVYAATCSCNALERDKRIIRVKDEEIVYTTMKCISTQTAYIACTVHTLWTMNWGNFLGNFDQMLSKTRDLHSHGSEIWQNSLQQSNNMVNTIFLTDQFSTVIASAK